MKDWIGKKVVKRSRKPFKSGLIEATVKGICVNPDSGKQAFSFEEDDSVVDCFICRLLK